MFWFKLIASVVMLLTAEEETAATLSEVTISCSVSKQVPFFSTQLKFLMGVPVNETFVLDNSASSTSFISAKAGATRTKHITAITGNKHGRKYFFICILIIFIHLIRTEHFTAELEIYISLREKGALVNTTL